MMQRYIVLFLLSLFYAFSAVAQQIPWAKQHLSKGISNPDSLAVVGQIIIVGNNRTKPQIILRELDFKKGDTLVKSNIKAIAKATENKIFNTDLFITVNISSQFDRTGPQMPNVVNLIIVLKERWYTFPIPRFDLADRNINEWWYDRNRDITRINYGINLVQQNVRGRNETLKLLLQHGFMPKYELFYQIPYVTKQQRDGADFGISYSTNRDVAIATQNNKLVYEQIGEDIGRSRFYTYLRYRRRTGFFQNQSLELAYHRNHLHDSLALLNPNYFLNGRTMQQYFRVKYSFTYDYRNVQYYPLKGYLAGIEVEKAGLGLLNHLDMTTLKGHFAKYFKLTKNAYFATAVYAKISAPLRQPYLQARALGYNNELVRGYQLYVMEAPHHFIQKNTVRYRLFEKTFEFNAIIPIKQFNTLPLALYVKGYFDHGYTHNPLVTPSNAALLNKYINGYGLGLDIVTYYNMVFEIDYAFNAEGGQGLFLGMQAAI